MMDFDKVAREVWTEIHGAHHDGKAQRRNALAAALRRAYEQGHADGRKPRPCTCERCHEKRATIAQARKAASE